MDFSTILLLAAVLGVVFGLLKAVSTSQNKQTMSSSLKGLDNFSTSRQLMGVDGNTGIAIDSSKGKVCLITRRGDSTHHKVIDYTDLVSVEILEDGSSVTKTSRISQLGGVVVGGLVLGGAGAVIGGLSGKKVTNDKVERLSLKIVVNNISNPIHEVLLQNTPSQKGGLINKQAANEARQWASVIEVLIKRADHEHNASPPPLTEAAHKSTISVADELKKLAELHQTGILTEDEFQQQKSRLLQSNS